MSERTSHVCKEDSPPDGMHFPPSMVVLGLAHNLSERN